MLQAAMSDIPPGFSRYVVTYCQEVVQNVDAPSLAAAASFAKNAAANVKGARVLSIFREDLPALPAP
jgi:hypothetical protein